MNWVLSMWVLTVIAVHNSCQDMIVTTSESEPDQTTPYTSETPPMKPKVKPTIRSLHINSDVKYRYATTLVSSRVVNPSDEPSEVTFSVTLPESAFISEFLMDVKGKVYKAYVKEKEEAKAEYNAAVEAGQFAGHVALQARDSNQFTVSVNVENQGKVTFNLTYEELLNRNQGTYSNVININPQQIVDDMSVTVNIQEPSAITDLEVAEAEMSNEALENQPKENKDAKIEEVSPNHKRIVWTPTPEQQKRQNSTGVSGQFIVKYDVDRKENSQQILVDEGYFVHFFAPEDLPKLKKHVIFVLDYSGSMAGRKLEQLKDAMDKILSDLSPTDFFSIVIFQSYVEVWSKTSKYSTATQYLSPWETEKIPENSTKTNLDEKFVVDASTENINLARNYLANYSDLGATNIMGGLRTGLELVTIGSRQWENESDPPQPVMIFLTDGQPNVEEYDTEAIINKTKPLNTKECPIFSLAFGYGADYKFLRKLSLSNNGFARNIYEAADASDQLKNFYETVSSPLLTNVTFNYLPGQVDNSSSTKNVFPVFFKGSEIIVCGKIKEETEKDNGTIGELTGRASDGVHTYPIVIQTTLQPENKTFGHLEKAWAYLRIQQLLDKVDTLDNGDEKNKTQDQARDLALQYSFVTPLTSLVVVKPNETESAVDTTKVKPGSEADSYYSNSFLSGGLSGASFSGVPQLALMAYPVPPMPYRPMGISSSQSGDMVSRLAVMPPRQSQRYRSHMKLKQNWLINNSSPQKSSVTNTTNNNNTGEGGGGFAGYASTIPSVQELITTDSSSEHNSTIVSLTDLKWLQTVLNNSSNAENVPIDIQGHQYFIALNKTDASFGDCQSANGSGQCRHLKFCPLNIFKEDVNDFIPYKCAIPEDFLGVCCPM